MDFSRLEEVLVVLRRRRAAPDGARSRAGRSMKARGVLLALVVALALQTTLSGLTIARRARW